MAKAKEPRLHGSVDQHDHVGGWVACAACQAEHVAERVGGLSWTTFIRDIMLVLGAHKPSETDEALNLRRVQAMGVDLKDAKEYWVRNFSGAAYVELRPQLKLPPSERARTWNGMAPCGIHGADFEGQACVLCPRPIVRLFDETSETCTPLGQQVSMHVRFLVDDLIKWALAQDPNISMRDLEYLLFSSLQMATARQILLRRRP